MSQMAGFDMPSLTGSLDVVLDDLIKPTTLQVIGSTLELGTVGKVFPAADGAAGTAPADVGVTTGRQDLAGGIFGEYDLAVRNGIGTFVMDSAVLVGGFTSGSQDWQIEKGLGEFFRDLDDDSLDLSGSENLAGFDLTDNGAVNGTLTSLGGGSFEIGIPFGRTLDLSSVTGTAGDNLIFTGKAVAVFAPGTPLNAASSTDSVEAPIVQATLVADRTVVAEDGTVTSLPESEVWIDEWDSYWVEVWGNAAGDQLDAASVEVEYNADWFTATEIDFGRAWSDSVSGAIDDESGTVLITGEIDGEQSGYIPLGRIRFESLDNDDISATDVIGPQASGITISFAGFELSIAGSVTPGLGVSPATQVIPVVYDIDDDDRIGFGDLSYFADAFSDSVVTTDSLQTWALDFDRSGSIGFGDLAFLADNCDIRHPALP
jgi:hypothetical protein